ncbi:peptide ligase PGM1-related protein [Streptomyces capparidis]
MPQLIIMNAGVDHTSGVPLTTAGLVRSTLRQSWFLHDGDIYVTPVPVGAGHVSYLARTISLDPASVQILPYGSVVEDRNLVSDGAVADLIARMAGTGAEGWTIFPCFATVGVAVLAEKLGVPLAGGDFARQDGVRILNRKSNFRALMAGAGLPIAVGHVVRSRKDLADAVNESMRATGIAIVKRDDGAGSAGNIAVTRCPLRHPPVGARDLWRLPDSSLASLASELEEADSFPVVVEVYHTARDRFYAELCIDEGGTASLQHVGSIRGEDARLKELGERESLGLDMPVDLKPGPRGTVGSVLLAAAQVAADIGYRGVLNVDGITTTNGEFVLNEMNARWGGGTMLHALARRLRGPDWSDQCRVRSLRGLPARAHRTFVAAMEARGVAFDPRRGAGAILVACDPSRSDLMECVLFGDDWDEITAIESAIFDLLDDDVA